MKQRLLKNNNKLTWRRVYLPLIIIPLILGIILSFTVFLVTRDQLKKTGQITVEKFSAQALSVLNELKIVNDSLHNNEQFIDLLTHETLQETEVRTIIRIISSQLSRNSYVQDALVISRPQSKTYTGDAHYEYSSFVSLLQGANAIPTQADTFVEDDLKEGWSVPDNNYASPYFVSYIKNSSGEKCATLVIILNKAYLYRTLFTTNSAFCCMYNRNFFISSFINSDPRIDYTSAADISRLVGEPVEIFSLESESYTFLTALQKNDFYRPIFIIFGAFGIYFLALIVFSFLHIRSANRRERAYFTSLIDELPQPVSKDSGITDIFTSIKGALDDYKEEHMAFSEQQKYRNLERLSQGYLGNLTEETAASMNLDLNARFYYMQRFHFSEEGILNPAHRKDLTAIILETAMNGFADGQFTAVCFPEQPNDICAILNVYDKDVNSESVHEIEKHIQKLLEKDYGMVFTCTLSAPVASLNEIPAAHQETVDLFRFVHTIGSGSRFISAEQLKNSPSFLIRGEFLKQMQVLSATLVLGKYDMVPDMVDRILEDHVIPLRKNYSMADERLRCIITLLHETPLPAYLTDEQIEEIHNNLKAANTVAELSNTVHNCFETLEATSYEDTIAQKACDYIMDNVSNISLSVPEIAENVGVSVQHLSKRFKESKGMTMVEYINQYRINKAQELLSSTSMNVAEIAEQIGYTNTVTLTRNFKRYVGCTPSEYRERSR